MPLAGSICTSGQVEKSFRMSKTDLAARPIFHHTRESIEAHLTIVFAALAISRWIENITGWSIKRFVTTARRYRTIQIQAGEHTITGADPLPDDLHAALNTIHGTHQWAPPRGNERPRRPRTSPAPPLGPSTHRRPDSLTRSATR